MLAENLREVDKMKSEKVKKVRFIYKLLDRYNLTTICYFFFPVTYCLVIVTDVCDTFTRDVIFTLISKSSLISLHNS